MSGKKKIVRDYSEMATADLKKMIQKNSSASRQAAKAAFKELEKREGDMGYSVTLILGGRKREPDTMDLPKSKPTEKERKKSSDDAKAKKLMDSLEKRAAKEIREERTKLGLANNKKKTAMARGGMAYGKEHMYVAGGSVQMNKGLKALKAASPESYNKITGK